MKSYGVAVVVEALELWKSREKISRNVQQARCNLADTCIRPSILMKLKNGPTFEVIFYEMVAAFRLWNKG
ncbi:hypothetical protein Trydic_g3699 [Trypoxylus dichotomus]